MVWQPHSISCLVPGLKQNEQIEETTWDVQLFFRFISCNFFCFNLFVCFFSLIFFLLFLILLLLLLVRVSCNWEIFSWWNICHKCMFDLRGRHAIIVGIWKQLKSKTETETSTHTETEIKCECQNIYRNNSRSNSSDSSCCDMAQSMKESFINEMKGSYERWQ